MRNRSKSLSYETSMKFEEEELDIDDELADNDDESEEPEKVTGIELESGELVKQVIEKVLNSLPKNDVVGYTRSLKKIKWDEIQIDGCKPKEVERIFNHAIKDVNKVRTLTEVLVDAKQRLNSFHQHPDHPKRPKTLFAMFVQDRFKQIKEENPEVENNDIMKMCSEEFKNLSEKKKQKLNARHAAMLEEYSDRMSKYKLQHPELKEISGKSHKRAEPKTPLAFYWQERSREMGKSDIKSYQLIRKEWGLLDSKQKAIYIRQFFEENKDESLSKAERKAYLESKGAPLRPPTAFAVYMQEHLKDYKELSAPERMKKIADLWSKLDKPTKERYINEANIEMEIYLAKWKKFTKSLTKEELKWIEVPKKVNNKKEQQEETDTDNNKEENNKKDKGKKRKSTALPEPQKPPEDVVTYFANKKFDGDRKEAKKKWKTLKESKQAKYQRQLEELQTAYFEDLKTYLKSLSTDEVKKYKKRMKKDIKKESEDSD